MTCYSFKPLIKHYL